MISIFFHIKLLNSIDTYSIDLTFFKFVKKLQKKRSHLLFKIRIPEGWQISWDFVLQCKNFNKNKINKQNLEIKCYKVCKLKYSKFQESFEIPSWWILGSNFIYRTEQNRELKIWLKKMFQCFEFHDALGV